MCFLVLYWNDKICNKPEDFMPKARAVQRWSSHKLVSYIAFMKKSNFSCALDFLRTKAKLVMLKNGDFSMRTFSAFCKMWLRLELVLIDAQCIPDAVIVHVQAAVFAILDVVAINVAAMGLV